MVYDTSKVKDTFSTITLDWILSRVTEYDIYAAYIGNFKVGMIYNSPLRKDKTPSLDVFIVRRLDIYSSKITALENVVM